MLHLILVILTQGMQWCHWCCCWSQVMPIPEPVVSHDQKSHVAPHFSFLDLRNAMVPVMTPLASCHTNTNTNGIPWIKKSSCISFWLSWPNKWNSTMDCTVIMWHCCKNQWHYMTNKVMLLIVSIALNYIGGIVNAIDITWCWCQHKVSNDWKSQVASHFEHLELTNTMVLLMMPLVSCDSNTGITWPKIILQLASVILTKQSCVIGNAISVMWCTGANSITWPEDSCDTLFQLSSPNEQNGAIYDVVSITWLQCWY